MNYRFRSSLFPGKNEEYPLSIFMWERKWGRGEKEAVKGLLCSGTVQDMGGSHGRDRGPAAVDLTF